MTDRVRLQPDPPRHRVAILGGGAGSMTAAYYLSCTPERRARFEVTVYQIGWRLGGKGASGRRASAAQRIEEHGLHVWGGFYHNAFRSMRECYQALGRPADAPLSSVDTAFLPAPDVFWEELVDGEWHHWPVVVPPTTGKPGEGGELPTIQQYLEMLIGFIRDIFLTFPHEAVKARAAAPAEALTDRIAGAIRGVEHLVRDVIDGSALSLLHAAHAVAAAADGPALSGHRSILELLEACWHWLESEVIKEIAAHDESRRLYVLADLAAAMARGVVRDDVIGRGFTAVDDWDFADWLRAHGASELALQSAPLRGFYDYFFAYDHGDPAQPRMSAAMGLYHLVRLVFTYKQSLFFKMASGMGDAVFGPLYEVCRRNGVRFRFFHEVLEVVPDEAANRIALIRVNRQVETKADYQPLCVVQNLPSWPSEPLWDQIRDDQAKQLQASGVDLEDPWSGWNGGTEVTLSAGRDFDIVVLGIPVGAHRMICPKLIERLPEWRQMVDGLHTIQTAALQLWWTRPMSRLGVTGPMATGTGYGQPLESWSDMSHVLPLEQWPGPDLPRTVVYFCGPMPTPERMPSGPDPGFGAGQKAAARVLALKWSEAFLPHLYPGSTIGRAIDWNALAVIDGSAGLARFDAQYIRANFTPSERYVLDLPGTSRYRLNADGSGFDNLLLAGDWVFTGLGGAVESAFIGGMQAAQALIGEPLGIVGALANPWSRLPRFEL
jgi:uncharacterized protein with NAD-binding domain and iron-sulfur cluster